MNVRSATTDDAAALAAIAADDEAALTGRPSLTSANDFLSWWSRTELEHDSRLFEEDGVPLAIVWFDLVDDLGIVVGLVAQGAKSRGLGAQLVDFGEERARANGAKRIQLVTLAADPKASELAASRGYEDVRHFFDMGIELDGAPREPSVPPGLRLERFREEEARAFYEALDESFADHWEHHSVGFEKWWEQKRAAPGFDPSLWFLIRDGGEVAATVRNEPERRGGGYVAALGVRRPWRGTGLGRALLLRTFREFHDRGVTRVTLGVDATSPTGATQLYQSVGMEVEMEAIVWEKSAA